MAAEAAHAASANSPHAGSAHSAHMAEGSARDPGGAALEAMGIAGSMTVVASAVIPWTVAIAKAAVGGSVISAPIRGVGAGVRPPRTIGIRVASIGIGGGRPQTECRAYDRHAGIIPVAGVTAPVPVSVMMRMMTGIAVGDVTVNGVRRVMNDRRCGRRRKGSQRCESRCAQRDKRKTKVCGSK